VTIFECFWIQVDDELLARKLQEEESAGLRNKMRKPSKRPVCDVNILQIISILNTHTHTHTWFLPRDASTERGDATVSRPSVCPSVRNDQVL